MPVTVHDKREEAYDFLRLHKVGVLATVDPNGNPNAAAVFFAVDSDLNVFFVTKSRTKKADNLEHNNHAMFLVYEASSQTTVQLTGEATRVTDGTQVNDLLTKVIYASLETSGSDIPPIAKLDQGEYVAYRLTPKEIRMAVYTHPESGSYQDVFKTINP